MLDKITIFFRKKLDGWLFSVSPLDRQKIMSIYPEAIPVSGLHIGDLVRTDFKQLSTALQKYILPTLTGLDIADLKTIHIEMVDSITGEHKPFEYE